MNKEEAAHNLKIESYTLDELLGLFEIKSYDISIEDLKRSKKKVLMLHPDKSRLPADYFLFYKKAFDVVVQFYETQNRQNQKITEETVKYSPLNTAGHNKNTTEHVTKVIDKMSKSDFQDKFNELFEKNAMATRPDTKRNEWFQKEDPVYKSPENQSVSAKNMGEVFDTMKRQNAGLVRYRGVETMNSSSTGGNFYDEVDDDSYVTSDPFSKLKFDDLRKVHKEQTVFAVSESDFQKVQTFQSVDQYNRERSKYSYDPMAKDDAQKILEQKEKMTKEATMRKQYEANIQSQKFAEKNKSVMAAFLQIQ